MAEHRKGNVSFGTALVQRCSMQSWHCEPKLSPVLVSCCRIPVQQQSCFVASIPVIVRLRQVLFSFAVVLWGRVTSCGS